jgi:A/G-specific adenine glycosylase
VGDYSARAVLSFAYGQSVAVVDTNVARILYRVFAIQGKFPQNPARKRQLLQLANELMPPDKSKEFNWAMIDLGALVCLPSKPLCYKCPLNKICEFRLQGEDKNKT